MKRIIVFLFCFVITNNLLGQDKISAHTIPLDLLENANMVVRNQKIDVTLNDLDELVIVKKRIVTVLNRFGDKNVEAYESYDDSRMIQKLSLTILDENGNEIKKVKKADFNDISAVSGGQLYTDNRVQYYDYKPQKYPYTAIFYSKVKEKSSATILNWYPIDGYYVSTEKSTCLFTNNTGVKHKVKRYNTNGQEIQEDVVDGSLKFSIENIPAVEKEFMSPSFRMIMPRITIALNEFLLKGQKGVADNWKNFGLWQYNDLLKGRDELREETIRKMNHLVSGVKNSEEKVKRIYEYVQNNTRYVGVQLGIGGWQPISANQVDKVKYGDCKGLTNYTKALLKTQGIESYYVIVNSGREKVSIDKSFSSLQGNHVILKVPVNEKDIWLECTSQTAPFGFLGDFTDDRDVLVVTPEGGVIERTPKYNKEDNLFVTKAKVQIKPNGSAVADVSLESYEIQYDDRVGVTRLNNEQQKQEYIDEWSFFNGLTIQEVKCKNDKENVLLLENITLAIDNYLTRVGDKWLLSVNLLNRVNKTPVQYNDRKLPFVISRSYKDVDGYEYELPKGITVEGLFKNVKYDNQFGSYSLNVKLMEKENKVIVKREFELNEGIYAKELYSEFRNFIKKIVRKDKLKIALVEK